MCPSTAPASNRRSVHSSIHQCAALIAILCLASCGSDSTDEQMLREIELESIYAIYQNDINHRSSAASRQADYTAKKLLQNLLNTLVRCQATNAGEPSANDIIVELDPDSPFQQLIISGDRNSLVAINEHNALRCESVAGKQQLLLRHMRSAKIGRT